MATLDAAGKKGEQSVECPSVGCKKTVTRSSLQDDVELMAAFVTFERRKKKELEDEAALDEQMTQRQRGAKKPRPGSAKKSGRGGMGEEEEEEM